MGLKILLSADWHMDSPLSSLPESIRDSLRREQLKLPHRIAEICREEGCDMMLLAGDIFDGIPSRQSLNSVRQALEQCGVPVFVAPGNHDCCVPGSPWLEERFSENVHVFAGNMEFVEIPELDCRIYGAGYQSMDCPPLLENFRAEGDRRWCIGLLHGDPTNSRSPYCPVTAAQIRESGLDCLALGHIHRAGQLRSGETLCLWPGCPMGRGWDETGEKGVYLLTLEQGVQPHWIPLDTPRFYDHEVNGEEAEKILEQLLPAAGSRDHYRVTMTGFGPVDLTGLKRQFDRIPNLILRDHTQTCPSVGEDEDTLMGVYFRLLRDRASQDESGKLALEISRKLLAGGEVVLP